MEIPKVFISYSWSSEEHVGWVLELAQKLMNDRVEVIIDRWSLKLGQDKNDFMEKMVKDDSVKKVLIICDKQYAEKANSRKGGVGIESQIISPNIYGEVNQEKFIPIIRERDGKGKPYIPVFLNGRFYIDFSDIRNYYEGYEELFRNIYDKPIIEKPPLGHLPAFILDEAIPQIPTTHKFMTFKDAVFRDKKYANGLARDYLTEIEKYFESHKIIRENELPLDEVILKSIDDYIPLRDEFIDFVFFINAYKKEDVIYEEIHNFFSRLIKYIRSDYSDHQYLDNYKYMVYELFLYFIAVLIRDEYFKELSMYVNKLYYSSDKGNDFSSSSGNLYHYSIFRPYIKAFEELRKNRLKLNVYNVTANIVKEKINNQIPTIILVQADYFLFIHSHLNQSQLEYIYHDWYPYTLVWESHGAVFPLFVKATSKEYYNRLAVPLQINSADELKEKIEALCKNNEFPDMEFLWNHKYNAHKKFMNFEKLSTTK